MMSGGPVVANCVNMVCSMYELKWSMSKVSLINEVYIKSASDVCQPSLFASL